jgi:histidinol-phosphate aminotransferase
MPAARRFTRVLDALPATVPFVAPDAIERRTGRPLRVRLGANESMFGISPRARRAMADAIERASCYGDPESFELRTALAARLSTTREHLVVGSGIDDLLGLTVRAFVEPGEPVVTSLGGYPTFAYEVLGRGGVLHRVPYRDDRNDLDGLLDEARRCGARMLYLANPDNPSGSRHRGAEIERLVSRLPEGCLLLLDEAYVDFAPPDSTPAIDPDDARVIRMRTFSKAHGLAGARVGYAVTAAATIAAFEKIRAHFGVNLIGQAGALASLQDEPFVESVVRAVAEGRDEYARLAAELGLAALPSATNFVALDLGTQPRARRALELLLERDVFVRMPTAPPLDRCIRVSVGRPEQRAELAAALRAILADGSLDRGAPPAPP